MRIVDMAVLVAALALAGCGPGSNDPVVFSFNLVREIGLDGWADTATPIRWRPSP